MRVSLEGVTSILSYEEVILTTYDDGYGVLTIGAGHTAKAGAPKPSKGMRIDLVEAFNIFRQDLEKFEQGVTKEVDVPLTQHQFDALVSWHYNTGSIAKATLTKRLNAGDYSSVPEEMARWKFAQGEKSDGLINRRKHEAAIFTSGDYGDRAVWVRQTKGAKATSLSVAEISTLMGSRPTTEEEESTEQLLSNPKSRLLPNYRPRQSAALSRQTLELFEHLVPAEHRDEPIKVLAVRGYYENTLGKKGMNDRGLYDDAIIVIEPSGVHNFNGNTDPSRHKKGIAQLQSQQAVRYIPGPHGYNRKNGPYPAFRQNSPCTVIRDNKGADTGIFWINLHRGGNTTTSSAGCQTIPPHQWDEFRNLLTTLLERYDQKTFQYLLLDEADIPDEKAVSPPAETHTGTHTDIHNEMPNDKATGDVIMANQQSSDVMEIIQAALALRARIRAFRTGTASASTTLGQGAIGDGKIDLNDALAVINAISGNDKLDLANLIGDNATKKTTPINGVFGDTIGQLLDGKKTGLGIIGLVGTGLLSIFAPELGLAANAVAAGADVIPGVFEKTIATAGTLFGGLGTWGILGKVEKWVEEIKQPTH